MSAGLSVAGAMLELLGRHGTTRVFGIPGVHNLPFWDVDSDIAPRIIGVRHEQAAGYAADALYRATGVPSAALLTSGPGTANVVTAFGEAFISGSPVIVMASEVGQALRHPRGHRGILHEMPDQGAMFEAFGATARSARNRQDAIASTVLALRDAWGPPPQGSYVGVPTDVLGEEWTAAVPHIPRLPSQGADPHEIANLAELLQTSQRVVLWLGAGVIAADAEEQARALAHRLGAPVLTSYAGRGLLAGDPLLVDAPVHEPEVDALLGDADLLLVIGSGFDAMNTKNWRMTLPPRRAALTLGEVIERTTDFDVLVAADVSLGLSDLAQELDERSVIHREPWTDVSGLRAAVLARLAADPRTAEAVAWVEQVGRGWPAEGAVICDMAVGAYWIGGYSSQPRPRRLMHAVGWGTLGYALPAAMGPAAVGIPTLAVCGDGGPMFALGELATMAQESLPVTVLIVDDAGYGMLRYDQQVFGHPERGVDLAVPEWRSLGQAFGITVETVSDVASVGAALQRAHEANLRGEPRMVIWSATLFPPKTQSPRWFE
ncbi:MAG: thiamine pyrophosphate-binding protein [Actinomycetales bacterium]|nr:thiamine pyrophosphate-binding protein [Actinomycetales bacterium]